MKQVQPDFPHLNDSDLLKIIGVKEPQAIYSEKPHLKVRAAMEISRRLSAKAADDQARATKVTTAEIVADYLRPLYAATPEQECFYLLCLGRDNKIIVTKEISRGGMTGTVADPRNIMKVVLNTPKCTSIVISHNHPSNIRTASRADEQITNKIKEAAKLFDITLLDHVIVTDTGYLSFAEEGLL